ncbi:MAG: hypothetical protein PHO02_04900 [Candidatus Nanoarchaeia archaeon]|nr:hypothetical protein [Candidatus Nanoarchaeia archaeon]
MANGISEEELIAIGDLETSSQPYVAGVRDILNNLENKLKEASSGLITSFENPAINRVTMPILLQTEKPRGFGYVASSFEHNKSMETLWAAIIAKAFMDSELNFHPVVMPIDEYYRFMPSYLSIVGKTEEISKRKMRDNSGRPYAVVLSGFTESAVFRQEVLRQMPNQHEIFGETGIKEPISMIKEFRDFNTYSSERIFTEQDGNIKGALEELSKYGKKEDAELLLCSALLLHDQQMWQNLWYECKEGIPLYIVAPFEFHEAMDRINMNWGHGPLDYNYRAGYSLRSNRYPPIGVVDGKLKEDIEYLEEEEPELIYKKGIKGAEFEARIKPILEKFPKAL